MFEFKVSDAMRRMLQARQHIVRRNPFFASLIFNAKLVETENHTSIVTDGISVFFNPQYVMTKEHDGFIEGDFLKCIMHCALLHMPRKQWRNLAKWNESSTLSVGSIVHQYFPQHPALMKKDGQFGDKAAEEIYELLEDQEGGGGGNNPPPPEGGNSDGNEEMPGGMIEPSPQDQEAAEQAAKDWKNALANATEKAKKAGNMPGNLKRLIEELQPADDLNWKDLIRDMARDAKAKVTRTWARPNRRRLGGDIMAPGYNNDAIYKIIVAFDTSGSVSEEQFREMKENVASALQQAVFTSALLISVDTCVHDPVEVSSVEELQAWHPTGGGGTDFDSALEFVAENSENAIGLIFLTDMYTCSFGKQPDIPVVWVNWLNNNTKAPYGRTVNYKTPN
jgi:predicted metal-dependent peptidase